MRLLLDSGSYRTYVTQALADCLGLEKKAEQNIQVTTIGSDKAEVLKTTTTTTTMSLKLKSGRFMEITANIVRNISGTIYRYPLKIASLKKLTQLMSNLKLADTNQTEKESDTLDLLVGNDYYLYVKESGSFPCI